MLLKMIAALIWGIWIGLAISYVLIRKQKSNKGYTIEILEDLLKVYEVHEEELKDTVNYYESGMNEALEQNIDLKRRLNNGNSKRI